LTVMKVAASVAAGGPAQPVARAGLTGKPLTRPETAYLLWLLGFLVVGATVGIILAYTLKQPGYKPPEGVSIFALFYIAAQALERLLEPLSYLYGRTKASSAVGVSTPEGVEPNNKLDKPQALKGRDVALAAAQDTGAGILPPEKESPTPLAEAAWWQEVVVQIRQNKSTLWGLASALGMVASGGLGLFLLEAVKAPHAPRWIDVLVTGLVVGGGTKPLHDLVSNIQGSSAAKKTPDQAGGTGS